MKKFLAATAVLALMTGVAAAQNMQGAGSSTSTSGNSDGATNAGATKSGSGNMSNNMGTTGTGTTGMNNMKKKWDV